VGVATGSREVPGKRKRVIREQQYDDVVDDDDSLNNKTHWEYVR
jgi:hypothetical protein